MSCMVGARYAMTADVYQQTVRVNKSGQELRVWDYENPVVVNMSCMVRAIAGGGIRVAGSTERFGPNYEDVEYADMACEQRLSKRHRVANIRDAAGNLLWPDDEDSETGMIFNVQGASPVLEPFSEEVVEYKSLLKAVEAD